MDEKKQSNTKNKALWIFENMKEVVDTLPDRWRGMCWKMIIEYAFGDDLVEQKCKKMQVTRTFKAIKPLIRLRGIAGSQNGKSNNPTGLPKNQEPNIGANIGANPYITITETETITVNKETIKEKTKNVWNAIAQRWDLAEIRALTDDREKKLKLRLKEQNMTLEQFFDEIRTAIEDSPFLRGKRWHEIPGHPDDSYWEDTDWRADFDFFLQPSSLQKAIEGKYADPTLRKERQRNQK